MIRYSAIARPIVLSLPSNRVPVIGFALAAALAGMRHRRSLDKMTLSGTEAFTAWAIARELDPDRPASAAAATALAIAWQAADALTDVPENAPEDAPENVPTLPSLLTSGAALASSRVLSSTVGPAPTTAEAALLGLGAGMAGYAGASAAAFAPAVAFALSAREGGRSAATPRQAASALALALVGLVAGRQNQSQQPASSASSRRALALALTAATALTLARPPQVTAPTDDGEGICVSRRVQLSRLLVAGMSGAALAVQRPRDVRATVLALLCAAAR